MSDTATADRQPAGFGAPPLEVIVGGAARFAPVVTALWLLFLVDPLVDHWSQVREPRVLAGYVSTAAFAVTLVVTFQLLLRRRARLDDELSARRAWALVVLLAACCLGIILGFGQETRGAVVYVALCAALLLPTAHSLTLLAAMTGALVVAWLAVPTWEGSFQLPLVTAASGFLMWGFHGAVINNVDLMRARNENEALLLEQERDRFARDLHDLLGHSLTVMAVKAELARRLLEVGDERAADEVADLERLSREALADVRRAVHGYREITLPGELARARAALAAAGISAQLPSSTDDVAGELREVFAWAIREGVTNILRHSRARTTEIELAPTKLRICNDCERHGVDEHSVEPLHEGRGLMGLRERVEAIGGTMTARGSGSQFELVVVGP